MYITFDSFFFIFQDTLLPTMPQDNLLNFRNAIAKAQEECGEAAELYGKLHKAYLVSNKFIIFVIICNFVIIVINWYPVQNSN